MATRSCDATSGRPHCSVHCPSGVSVHKQWWTRLPTYSSRTERAWRIRGSRPGSRPGRTPCRSSRPPRPSIAAPQRYTITAFNLLEELSLDWLAELCGLGGRMQGVYSSGGSVANLVALGAARQWALEQAGIDPAADGLGGAPVARLRLDRGAPHGPAVRGGPWASAARGSARSRPTIASGCGSTCCAAHSRTMSPRASFRSRSLRRRARRTPAPSTRCETPARLAREYGAWFHVDGAYGLLGQLDERIAPLYDGLELADSAIIDPHKWLGAPVGIAATFVRDRSILHRAFTQEPAAYLEGAFDATGDVRMSRWTASASRTSDFAVELSAPSRGVSGLEHPPRDSGATVSGADPPRQRLRPPPRRSRPHAHPRLELVTEPVLSICCFRYTATESPTSTHSTRRCCADSCARRRTCLVPPSSTEPL